jgi:hypothetical protein
VDLTSSACLNLVLANCISHQTAYTTSSIHAVKYDYLSSYYHYSFTYHINAKTAETRASLILQLQNYEQDHARGSYREGLY